MEELSGPNIEGMIDVTQLKGDRLQKPNVEELVDKFRKLQRGEVVLEKEIQDLKSVSDRLQDELAALQTEANQMEETRKEKQELCNKLQLQLEESEQDSNRQLRQNKKSEELLEQHRCEIQEVKLKHRKLRMRFESDLRRLTEQLKQLHSVFSLGRVQQELESAQNTRSQLLSVEQLKLAQLQKLDEELEQMKRERQSEDEAAQKGVNLTGSF